MLRDFHVVGIDFDTPEWNDWRPQDPLDCEVWATAAVGDNRGTANYQLHICTPLSIRRIADKRRAFMIDEFHGVDDLVRKLDAFIEDKVANKPGDPYQLLSKHWVWEYDGASSLHSAAAGRGGRGGGLRRCVELANTLIATPRRRSICCLEFWLLKDRQALSRFERWRTSSQAVREGSESAYGCQWLRITSTSIWARLAARSVTISAWSCSRNATIFVKIRPSGEATRRMWPSVHVNSEASASAATYKGRTGFNQSMRTVPKRNVVRCSRTNSPTTVAISKVKPRGRDRREAVAARFVEPPTARPRLG